MHTQTYEIRFHDSLADARARFLFIWNHPELTPVLKADALVEEGLVCEFEYVAILNRLFKS